MAQHALPVIPYQGKFTKQKTSKSMTILNDWKIKLSSSSYQSATMDKPIRIGENAIYSWKFMLESADSSDMSSSEFIGVVSNRCNNYGRRPWGGLIDSYGISGKSPNVWLGTSRKFQKDQKYVKIELKSKQVVTIELNCVTSKITFKLKNRIIYGPYKLPQRHSWYPTVCLSFSDKEFYDSATFIPLKQKQLPNVEEKDELRDLKKQNEALKQENIQLNDQVLKEVQKSSLVEHQKNAIMQKYEILQNKLKEQGHIIEKLQNERKEMEMENIKLKEENKKLKIANIDVNNFETWTCQQILFWILTLENGRFNKYEKQLQKAFVEEDIDGSCIEQVDGTDIKNWGINNFKERKAMIMHFQMLNQNKKAKQMNDEGANAPTAYL